MTLKVAYFQPTIIAIDDVPAIEFSRLYNLTEDLHGHPELNDSENPLISIRGGQQIQVYPNELELDIGWLVKWLEQVCTGYLKLVSDQSGAEELKMLKPVVVSIWTIQQGPDQYQEIHSHPLGNLSGNIYISAPELAEGSASSDGQIAFRLPQTKDIGKFIMNDTWKYAPTPGTMILFPSHIPHMVYPWKGLGTRTVVAFDARLVPKEDIDGQP
jgi:hypothetical protein